MSAAVRSELLKIRTTRAWWVYLGAVAAFAAVGAAGTVGSARPAERSTLDLQLSLADLVGLAGLLALLLGITIVTAEYRHGTITPTFLATPRRERVLGAKAVAGIAVSGVFLLVALAVVAAVALTWLALIDAPHPLGEREVWERVGRQALGVVLAGLLGVAIGALVHSQVGALVGTLVWLFLGETLSGGLLGLVDAEGVAAYLPFRAIDGTAGTEGADLLGFWPGLGVASAWIVALGAAGTLRTLRRDVS